jgi:hypothetical protein
VRHRVRRTPVRSAQYGPIRNVPTGVVWNQLSRSNGPARPPGSRGGRATLPGRAVHAADARRPPGLTSEASPQRASAQRTVLRRSVRRRVGQSSRKLIDQRPLPTGAGGPLCEGPPALVLASRKSPQAARHHAHSA